jgi:hypothetical protein
MTSGPVVTGVVGGSRGHLQTTFQARENHWEALVGGPDYRVPSLALGMTLPHTLQTITNGIALGVSPFLGFEGSDAEAAVSYRLAGDSTTWRAPARPTYRMLMYDARSFPQAISAFPRSTDPEGYQWVRHAPFTATWERADPKDQNAAHAKTFIAGLLLGLAVSAFLAVLQVVVRPRHIDGAA